MNLQTSTLKYWWNFI